MQMMLKLYPLVDWTYFIENFIPEKLLNNVLLNYNEDKASLINDYLQEELKIGLSAKEIITYAIENLHISKDNDDYTVMIDGALLVPGTKYNLLNIVKLIDSGNLEVRGLNIVSQAFAFIVMQLPNLIALYRLTRRGDKP